MQPHKKIINLCVNMGVCAPPDGTVLYIKRCYKFSAALVFAICFSGFASFTARTFQAEDFESSLSSACDVVNMSYTTYLIVATYCFREELKQIFLKIQQNYDQCKTAKDSNQILCFIKSFISLVFSVKDDDCIKYLVRADRWSQRVAKVMINYFAYPMGVLYLVTGVFSVASSLYKDGYIDPEQLTKPYPVP